MDGKTPLIIEIKSRHEYTGEYLDALCHATLDGLKGYNGPYCIESFDPRVVKCIRKFAPQVLRGQLVDSYRAYRKEGANPIHAFVISTALATLWPGRTLLPGARTNRTGPCGCAPALVP